ncbi:MAG: Hsp20/alpha crystallin family protein [Verrucomicrobiota bacterium]
MNDCNRPLETAPAKESRETAHRPQFRTKEDANGAALQIALPGVRKEDVKLTLHETCLRIEADRHDEVQENWKTHRDTGSVRRYGLDIRLTPRLDGTKATASFESGVLELRVPIREESKPRQITVN